MSRFVQNRKKQKQVFVGIVHHRHGENVYTSRTEAGVFKQVVGYVKDEWESELNSDLPTNLSDEDLVKAYFDEMGNVCGGEEWFEIVQSELVDE